MKNFFSFTLAITFFLVSCQKEMSLPGTDSQRLAVNARIMKSVEIWDSRDSLVTEYGYDASDRLVSANSLSGWGYFKYERDESGRIIKIQKKGNTADIGITHVFYSGNTEKVNYTISESSGLNSLHDSTAYFYDADKVVKTELYVLEANDYKLSSYNEWAYSPTGNLSNLKVFVRNANGNIVPDISYDFEYDNKVNPFYAADDARIVENWYMVVSPNNLVKQTNHYDASGMPDDYISLDYEYSTDNKPFKGVRSGPAIGTSVVASSFFYE